MAAVAEAFRSCCIEKVEFQVRIAELVHEFAKQPLQMIAHPRMAWVERVRELVLVAGPVGIVASGQWSAAFVLDEPVRMIAHDARIARSQKRRAPDSGLETGRTD